MIRVSEGKYRIGDTQILIFVRVSKNISQKKKKAESWIPVEFELIGQRQFEKLAGLWGLFMVWKMYLGSLDLLLEISGVDYSPQFEWNVNFHFYFFHQNGKERDFMLREAALVFSAKIF